MKQNFNFIYQTSFDDVSFVELQKHCTDLITKGPDKLFKSPNFCSISEKLLVTIIQNGNLQMSEIQVWERIIKWGLVQNPDLPSDIIKFSKNDFNILKNTIQQCIPFIKFFNLTSKEFLYKVFPYRDILPEELYINLLKFFLNSNYIPSEKKITLKSMIISDQHIELISKWIDKSESSDKLTSSYDFKLLFRGSRDGLTQNKFHQCCDNKSRTVTIIKVKDSNEILGGYNPVEWKYDGGYEITKDSFIFSFNNNDSIENCILSRVMDESHAIFNSFYYGPSFGTSDIIIWSKFSGKSICRKSSYEKSIRKTDDMFIVEECEIFQIEHN
jgi:hypothetical protein